MITKTRIFAIGSAIVLGVMGFQANAQEQKLLKASKFFPLLDKLLSLPASKRDGIIVNYYANIDGKPPENVFLIHNGNRTKLNFNAKGKVLNLPSLDAVTNGQIEYLGKKGSKTSIGFDGEPNIILAQKIPTSQIQNSIDDMKSCVAIAGPFALLIPKVTSVAFKGVNQGSAVFSDGSKVPLTATKDGVIVKLDNAKTKSAVFIEFNSRPSGVEYFK